jgi:hypothetical protein
MSKQIKSLDGFLGKTIECALSDGSSLRLRFTDGDYAALVAVRGYDDDVDIEVESGDLNYAELHELGLLSDEEYQRRHAEHRRRTDAAAEAHERQQFERLRAKYGGKS